MSRPNESVVPKRQSSNEEHVALRRCVPRRDDAARADADVEKATAAHVDGVLTITLPKKAAPKEAPKEAPKKAAVKAKTAAATTARMATPPKPTRTAHAARPPGRRRAIPSPGSALWGYSSESGAGDPEGSTHRG